MATRHRTLPASICRSLEPPSPAAMGPDMDSSPFWHRRGTSLSISLGDSADVSVSHRRFNAVSFSSMSEDFTSQAVGSRARNAPFNDNGSPVTSLSRSLPVTWPLRIPSHASVESTPSGQEPQTVAFDGGSSMTQTYFHFPNLASLVQTTREEVLESPDPPRYVLRPSRVLHVSSCSPSGSSLKAFLEFPDEKSSLHTAAVCEQVNLPQDECAICLEAFKQAEVVQPMVGCEHLFHKSCVGAYIQTRREEALRSNPLLASPLGDCIKCPLCRSCLATPRLEDVPQHERDSIVLLEDSLTYSSRSARNSVLTTWSMGYRPRTRRTRGSVSFNDLGFSVASDLDDSFDDTAAISAIIQDAAH